MQKYLFACVLFLTSNTVFAGDINHDPYTIPALIDEHPIITLITPGATGGSSTISTAQNSPSEEFKIIESSSSSDLIQVVPSPAPLPAPQTEHTEVIVGGDLTITNGRQGGTLVLVQEPTPLEPLAGVIEDEVTMATAPADSEPDSGPVYNENELDNGSSGLNKEEYILKREQIKSDSTTINFEPTYKVIHTPLAFPKTSTYSNLPSNFSASAGTDKYLSKNILISTGFTVNFAEMISAVSFTSSCNTLECGKSGNLFNKASIGLLSLSNLTSFKAGSPTTLSMGTYNSSSLTTEYALGYKAIFTPIFSLDAQLKARAGLHYLPDSKFSAKLGNTINSLGTYQAGTGVVINAGINLSSTAKAVLVASLSMYHGYGTSTQVFSTSDEATTIKLFTNRRTDLEASLGLELALPQFIFSAGVDWSIKTCHTTANQGDNGFNRANLFPFARAMVTF